MLGLLYSLHDVPISEVAKEVSSMYSPQLKTRSQCLFSGKEAYPDIPERPYLCSVGNHASPTVVTSIIIIPRRCCRR